MPDYDFKCMNCGVVVVSSHDRKTVPDMEQLYCPGKCQRQTDHLRILSIPAVGRGGSGERFRRSL